MGGRCTGFRGGGIIVEPTPLLTPPKLWGGGGWAPKWFVRWARTNWSPSPLDASPGSYGGGGAGLQSCVHMGGLGSKVVPKWYKGSLPLCLAWIFFWARAPSSQTRPSSESYGGGGAGLQSCTVMGGLGQHWSPSPFRSKAQKVMGGGLHCWYQGMGVNKDQYLFTLE